MKTRDNEVDELIDKAVDKELDLACSYLRMAFESAVSSCKTTEAIDERTNFLIKALEYESRNRKNKLSGEIAFSNLQKKFNDFFLSDK